MRSSFPQHSTPFSAVVTMSGWKLGFVLLLLTSVCFGSQVTNRQLKTVGYEALVTPVCDNKTTTSLMWVVCKIRTERNREQECLLSRYRADSFNGCDSRFTLVTNNRTVFLHLNSLTPADSGIYTCECSYHGRTDVFRFNVTVNGEKEVSTSTKAYVSISSIAVLIVISVAGVLLGFIHQMKSHKPTEAAGLPDCETPSSLDANEPEDPYASLQYRADDLYQTISSIHHQHDAKTSPEQNNSRVHVDDEDSDSRDEIYENFRFRST
ncbi:uncharacterized protein LOC103361274 [Stegastes partitus]|uniref:Uncharacterized protein LOC103361274 n=1 Tax=Stegastes partitus TaxID=144197 RepID=A0A9Y4JZS0_9TELE|nr:PREDICTED: uncharacterized protein LOC103361274 [Stegastes partitus]